MIGVLKKCTKGLFAVFSLCMRCDSLNSFFYSEIINYRDSKSWRDRARKDSSKNKLLCILYSNPRRRPGNMSDNCQRIDRQQLNKPKREVICHVCNILLSFIIAKCEAFSKAPLPSGVSVLIPTPILSDSTEKWDASYLGS